MTRVRSAWNATVIMSVISLKCSAKSAGTPYGFSMLRIDLRVVLLGLLELPLDLADRGEILVQLAPVGRAETRLAASCVSSVTKSRMLRRYFACARARFRAQHRRRRRTAARTARADRGSAAAAASRCATPGCWCRRRNSRNRNRPPGARPRARLRATGSASACRSGWRRSGRTRRRP